MDLEELNCEDPEKFWESIKCMGRKQNKPIPCEVYMQDGTISCDIDDVLSRWMADYGSLFSEGEENIERDLYVQHVKGLNAEFMNRTTYGPHREYDRNFTFTKVSNIVRKSKDKKALGYDGIANEFMKNDQCIRILTELFNTCFTLGLLLSSWLKAVINPIPKNLSSDPRVPLNYRGISLLPVISKMYTALVGSRVGGFL